MSYRHSFIVITFNHEHWIRQSLDSIFTQQIIPYEVIIGDDCSTDGTRDILLEYQKKYPEVIKLIFHPVNLGMYANLNSLRRLVTGDIIHLLAGDDWFEGELISDMNNAVEKKGLNPEHDSFLIMTNFFRYEDGEFCLVNNYQYKDIDSVTAKIQNLIANREIGMSRCLFNRIPDHNEKVGPWADWLWDIGRLINSEKVIFLNKAYPVYRVGVGVTVKKPQIYFDNSYIATIDEIIRQYGKNIGFGNRIFLRMQRARTKYRISNSAIDLAKYMFVLSITIPFFKSKQRLLSEIWAATPKIIKRIVRMLK